MKNESASSKIEFILVSSSQHKNAHAGCGFTAYYSCCCLRCFVSLETHNHTITIWTFKVVDGKATQFSHSFERVLVKPDLSHTQSLGFDLKLIHVPFCGLVTILCHFTRLVWTVW